MERTPLTAEEFSKALRKGIRRNSSEAEWARLAEVAAIAFETHARLIASARLGMKLKVQGFLAAKSKRSKRLVLHATNIEFIEGETNATAAQR